MEEWRDIEGYEGLYQVSDIGRVKRLGGSPKCHHDRIRKPATDAAGYKTITLSKANHIQGIRIHRLVAIAFLGLQPSKEVNHKNGNKADNRLENLEWLTRSENLLHRHRVLGLKLRRDDKGEKNLNSKLTNQDVREIRRLYATGNFSQAELSKTFRICSSGISHVITGRTWSHVTESND